MSPGVLSLGSLFTGTGALDMAAAAVLGPLRITWVSDTKPAAQRFLAHRFPGVPNLGDMTRMWPAIGPLTSAAAAVEPIDVLTAGWPCQPHSAAGKRLGERDHRALWPNVIRAIQVIRPTVFLGENVARIVTNGELRRVIRSLAALGYVGAWGCYRASGIGAPHRRDRCFVVAVDLAAYARCGLAALTHALAGGGAGPAGIGATQPGGRRRGTPDALTLLPTPRAGDAIRGGGDAHAVERAMRGDASRSSATGISLNTAVTLLPTPRALIRDQCAPSEPVSWGRYSGAVQRWEHVFGRRAPAPTQVGPRGGLQLAPPLVEWMMGLPDGWVTDVPDLAPRATGHRNAALSMLGDGVVPQQAEYAYRELLGVLFGRLAAERPA